MEGGGNDRVAEGRAEESIEESIEEGTVEGGGKDGVTDGVGEGSTATDKTDGLSVEGAEGSTVGTVERGDDSEYVGPALEGPALGGVVVTAVMEALEE